MWVGRERERERKEGREVGGKTAPSIPCSASSPGWMLVCYVHVMWVGRWGRKGVTHPDQVDAGMYEGGRERERKGGREEEEGKDNTLHPMQCILTKMDAGMYVGRGSNWSAREEKVKATNGRAVSRHFFCSSLPFQSCSTVVRTTVWSSHSPTPAPCAAR